LNHVTLTDSEAPQTASRTRPKPGGSNNRRRYLRNLLGDLDCHCVGNLNRLGDSLVTIPGVSSSEKTSQASGPLLIRHLDGPTPLLGLVHYILIGHVDLLGRGILLLNLSSSLPDSVFLLIN
jgi:hypothetical protein